MIYLLAFAAMLIVIALIYAIIINVKIRKGEIYIIFTSPYDQKRIKEYTKANHLPSDDFFDMAIESFFEKYEPHKSTKGKRQINEFNDIIWNFMDK